MLLQLRRQQQLFMPPPATSYLADVMICGELHMTAVDQHKQGLHVLMLHRLCGLSLHDVSHCLQLMYYKI